MGEKSRSAGQSCSFTKRDEGEERRMCFALNNFVAPIDRRCHKFIYVAKSRRQLFTRTQISVSHDRGLRDREIPERIFARIRRGCRKRYDTI